jgi:hypothetical protein
MVSFAGAVPRVAQQGRLLHCWGTAVVSNDNTV